LKVGLELISLNQYAFNTYSQFGEDGIVQEIFHRLVGHVELDKWCVEFGAWDGVHLSNTCRLIRENRYSGVLIEGNPKRLKQIERNFPDSDIYALCKFVTFDGVNTLDKILLQTPIPKNYDFLSIDIDGADYYILESIVDYLPKVICIEFNPTIPNQVDFVQPKNFEVKQGSSAKAIVRLANSKGYELVAATEANLIFVQEIFVNCTIGKRVNLEDLNLSGNEPQYLFSGYDGTLLSNKPTVKLPWHCEVPLKKFQILPRYLRVFSADYGFARNLLFITFLVLKFPKSTLAKFRRRLRNSQSLFFKEY
jgi:hypothetical protein